MKSILEFRIRSNHEAAAGDDVFLLSPRQICPPGSGLSSTTVRRPPLAETRQAAAKPAGPAPTTNTSVFTALLVSSYIHPVLTNRLTTTNLFFKVDRHATFETDSHSTQRTAGFT